MSSRIVIGAMCALCLAVSGTAFGYGIDGTQDSADFENLFWDIRDGVSDYWNYSFEGGTPTAPLGARLTGWDSDNDRFSSYDDAGNTDLYNSDGSTLSHTPYDNWGYDSTGWYKPFNNGVYIPQGTTNAHGIWSDGINDEDGFTVEWRMALGDHYGTDGIFMQFDVTDARDGWIRVNEQQVQFGVHGWVTAPTNTELMNTYRIACLGVNPSDPTQVMGSLWQNNDLLFEEVQIGTVGTVSSSSYLWAMVDFGTGLYYGSTETDYVRWDIWGAYAPIPEPTTMLLLGGGVLGLLRRRK